MVKAEELRIGNLVQSKSGKNYYSIAGISRLDFILSNKKTGLFSSHGCHMYGIPLSEEILLKCGFESNELVLGHIKFIWYGVDNLGIKSMLGMIKPSSIKCLHQLQNLYFALIGRELNVKL